MEISEILNILGEDREQYRGAVTPPVHQTSNFAFASVDALRHAFEHEKEVSVYSRGNNPTVDLLCKKLAALEETEDALVLSSGSAAIATAVISFLKAGDHVVCTHQPYSWTKKLFDELLSRFGVSTTYVDASDITRIEKAIRPETRMIYLESPSTFYFELQDLEAVARLAKARNIITLIDNSYCSPLVQKPATFGIDVVLYSATKYLNGHSDVVAGAICSSKEIIAGIFRKEFMTLGAIAAPWNAWLLLRGLRTLPIRIDRSSQSTIWILEKLKDHPRVKRIYHPFMQSGHKLALAQKQMKQPMGLFSLELDTADPQKVTAFCESLKHFLMAVSWGGHESLIMPAIAFPGDSGFPVGFIRFYIGLEEKEVLWNDLSEALRHI